MGVQALIPDGFRFPRSMLANPASERLLVLLGVTIVDELDGDLEAAAREWLESVSVGHVDAPSSVMVRDALSALDARRAA